MYLLLNLEHFFIQLIIKPLKVDILYNLLEYIVCSVLEALDMLSSDLG